MTEQELDMLERLWNDGVAVKVIADELGYTVRTINYTVSKDRERFPLRQKRTDETPYQTRERWVARIRAGRATVAQAALATGVTQSQVYKWMKDK